MPVETPTIRATLEVHDWETCYTEVGPFCLQCALLKENRMLRDEIERRSAEARG